MHVNDLVPPPDLFAHRSQLHGQNHVARVMVHAFRLLEATEWQHEAGRLWAAVYLHDLARTHDGVCHRHGADAVARWQRTDALDAHLRRGGMVEADRPAVERAVTVHCRPDHHEPAPDDPDWPLVALLKDADGLDRVRLGDLDPARLRLAESREMVAFAERLFDETVTRVAEGPTHFEALLGRAEAVAGQPVAIPPVLV